MPDCNENIITSFLKSYPPLVQEGVDTLRIIIKKYLPKIQEQADLPAKMIAYVYGERYTDMICCMFPSKNGFKLSFYRGVDLPDLDNYLKGKAKTTRYLSYKTAKDINIKQLKYFLFEALKMYEARKKQN
ncbi:MAG: DUF1801 domain-containing protein [Niabella sp.]